MAGKVSVRVFFLVTVAIMPIVWADGNGSGLKNKLGDISSWLHVEQGMWRVSGITSITPGLISINSIPEGQRNGS